MRSQPFVLNSLLLLLIFLSEGSWVSAQSATVVADYQFNNTLSSSVSGVPGLVNNGSSGTNTFITDTVDGQSRAVLQFPNGNGVNLSPTTGVLEDGSYAIVLLFKFDAVTGYRKIIDFKNRSVDLGFYNRNGSLLFYDFTSSSNGGIAPNTFVQVVLTRDSAGSTTGYVNGVQMFNFQDTRGDALPDGNARPIFFRMTVFCRVTVKESHPPERSRASESMTTPFLQVMSLGWIVCQAPRRFFVGILLERVTGTSRFWTSSC